MRLVDKGTELEPWIVFYGSKSGIAIIDGSVVLVAGGRRFESLRVWLDKMHSDGHIDAALKWAIIAASRFGGSAWSSLLLKLARKKE